MPAGMRIEATAITYDPPRRIIRQIKPERLTGWAERSAERSGASDDADRRQSAGRATREGG